MKIHKSVFQRIAEEHGVTVGEIKKDMQKAIDAAYENPNVNAETVPRRNDIPTIDEFIRYIADSLDVDDFSDE